MFKRAANRTTDAAGVGHGTGPGIGSGAGLGRRWLVPAGLVAVAAAVTGAEPVALIRGWTLPFREKDRLTARFSGETAVPETPSTFLVHGFKLESYDHQQERELSIEAPECRVDATRRSASGPGSLKVTHAAGLFTLEGAGFDFVHTKDEQHLRITNGVKAVVRVRLANPDAPAALPPL